MKVYQGALAVAIVGGATSVGYYRQGVASPNVVAVGRFTQTVDNTAGADGALSAEINFFTDRWLFLALNDTAVAVAVANRESACYVLDDQTVTANGSDTGIAGVVYDVTSEGVWLEVRRQNPQGVGASVVTGTAGFARAVVTTLAANTGSGTGTLTASANGAFGTQDGVTTLAVGDVVFIPEGIANLSAAKDAGPWVIAALGAGGAKWQLQRPSWWATGNAFPGAIQIQIGGEGTFWAGTEWKSFAAKASSVIDANAPLLYPGRVSQSVTLVAGAKAVTNVPILSAASGVEITRTATGGTVTTSVMYNPSAAPTPGVLGTASLTLNAQVAAGTIQNTDTSVLTVTITNW